LKRPVVVIGIGEMGGVFARGFLRTGYPVFPVTRELPLAQAAKETPNPELVMLAVAEKGLHNSLSAIPDAWKNSLGLLQQEKLTGQHLDHKRLITAMLEAFDGDPEHKCMGGQSTGASTTGTAAG
jgi:hypothetical protein